jgi:hypothetical protein
MAYVEWTPDMGEISGFGGSYEDGCRAMVKAGVEYIENSTDPIVIGARLAVRGTQGGDAFFSFDNKALTSAMLAAPIAIGQEGRMTTVGEYGPTGAMVGASLGHIAAFFRLGAEEYCRELRDREKEPA